MIDTGTSLGDRYRLEERIAVGGMGEVWRARDDVLGRDVAVKVLRSDLAADDSFVERFRDEARHTAALSHPGIAAVHDYAETDGDRYLVMELVEGEPLSELLAREGRLSVERTLDLVAQVALALQAAHDAGVIHRDIKPGNLLVRPDGIVKVTDFGIARAAEVTSTRTQTGTVLGTAHYLSPEAARGEPASAASDIYALGVVGYECLAGFPPFTGTNPVAVATAHLNDVPPPLPVNVPREVTMLILSCLAKAPEQRLAPASAVAEQALTLKAAMTGLGTETTALPLTAAAPAVDDRAIWRTNAPGQQRVRRTLIVAAAVAVILGFLLIRACAAPSHPSAANPKPSPAPTVRLVTVAAQSYLGRPQAEVVRELRALGLRPTTRLVTPKDDHVLTGTVIDVTPTGALRPGAAVTVSVAQPPPSHHHEHKHGKDKGGND